LIFLLPNIVRSDTVGELVEVYLINQIDDQRGYCIDIKGSRLIPVIRIKERSQWIKGSIEKE
jgi:hypothetical protein